MKLVIVLLIATCALVYCRFDIEYVNSTRNLNLRATGEYPVFKVQTCPNSDVVIAYSVPPSTKSASSGKYVAAGCLDSLTDNSLTIKGICYRNDASDQELGVQSYTLVITYILDESGDLYYGDFFIKDYSYGKIKVIVDRTATIGGNTNLFYNTYQCGTDFCSGSTFYTGCTTQKVTSDLNGAGSTIIVTTNPASVNFCMDSTPTCCTFPATCVPTTFTVTHPPAAPQGGYINSAEQGVAKAIAQPFTLAVGALTITSFGFVISTNNLPIDYKAYIYEWDDTNKLVIGSPLFTFDGIANKPSFSVETINVSPPITLSSSKTYVAILSARDKVASGPIYVTASSVVSVIGFYTLNSDFAMTWVTWTTTPFSATFV